MFRKWVENILFVRELKFIWCVILFRIGVFRNLRRRKDNGLILSIVVEFFMGLEFSKERIYELK